MSENLPEGKHHAPRLAIILAAVLTVIAVALFFWPSNPEYKGIPLANAAPTELQEFKTQCLSMDNCTLSITAQCRDRQEWNIISSNLKKALSTFTICNEVYYKQDSTTITREQLIFMAEEYFNAEYPNNQITIKFNK